MYADREYVFSNYMSKGNEREKTKQYENNIKFQAIQLEGMLI